MAADVGREKNAAITNWTALVVANSELRCLPPGLFDSKSAGNKSHVY